MNTVETAYASCTPHRPGARFHISYDDFDEIALDIYNSGALRAFQVATDQRIRWLRRTHGIPATHLPSVDDLWIAMPYKAVEKLTLKRVGHSVCQRVLAEESIEDAPPSLLELGFLRRRFVARRTSRVIKDVPATVYREKDGEGDIVEFIVTDENGDYIGIDGKEYSAPLQGFGLIERQYLYCIEEIRAAIAALDYLEPPRPQPRWEAMIERRGPKEHKESAAAQRTAIPGAGDATTNEQNLDARRGTTTSPETSEFTMSFAKENNIAVPALSIGIDEKLMRNTEPVRPLREQAQQFMLYRNTIDIVALRRAPWTPGTAIGLTSLILDVPAKPDESDEEAWQRWIFDWWAPACWIVVKTKGIEPRNAWERVQRRIHGMLSGPTWYATKRTTPEPITLRNVVGPADPTKPLSGYNWRVVEAELDRAAWHPNEVIVYDGPPLIIEEDREVTEQPGGTITGIIEVNDDQAPQRDEEPREELAAPLNDEPATNEGTTVSALPTGMPYDEAQELMVAMHGWVIIEGANEIAPGLWEIYVAVSDDDAIRVVSLDQWYAPPGAVPAIDEAIAYAQAKHGGGSSPPMEEPQQQGESEENNDEQRSDGGSTAMQDNRGIPSDTSLSEDGDATSEPGTPGADHCAGRLQVPVSSG